MTWVLFPIWEIFQNQVLVPDNFCFRAVACMSRWKLGGDRCEDQRVSQKGRWNPPWPHHHSEWQKHQNCRLPLGETFEVDRHLQTILILQPEQLKEVIDFGIPEEPLNLDQLLVDCKDTLKYQVKTGEDVTLACDDVLKVTIESTCYQTQFPRPDKTKKTDIIGQGAV